MKRIHVVAGVIEQGSHDHSGEILLARRLDHVHQGGKWEFPGGKVESGEEPSVALARELKEELDIDVTQAEPLIRIRHDYPDKSVLLDVWRVTAFTGEARGVEGQEVRWVTRNALVDYEFPAANVPIVSAARLPRTYAISPDFAGFASNGSSDKSSSTQSFLDALEATVKSGVGMIQLRVKSLRGDVRSEAWQLILNRIQSLKAEHSFSVLVNSDVLAENLNQLNWDQMNWERMDGVHLTSSSLMALTKRPDGIPWLSASCHSPEELEQAQQLGVDFVTLSPVLATQSHPDVEPIGWRQFEQWVEGATVPVFALGGLQSGDLETSIRCGAQGVAGIRGLWGS